MAARSFGFASSLLPSGIFFAVSLFFYRIASKKTGDESDPRYTVGLGDGLSLVECAKNSGAL